MQIEIGYHKEFLKLMFWVLALRESEWQRADDWFSGQFTSSL